ncbi:MAG: IMP cyclohydrolase [Deltaproteobacteria bacterium]|nr:IMP cyclohydrolase [Deltaproteobacteria bacterium]
MSKIDRAIVSVSDKTGIVDFVKGLTAMGVEILSTGGTARILMENGVRVMEVSEYTGFPEIMDGRVKTLHPKIHGGLMEEAIENIDIGGPTMIRAAAKNYRHVSVLVDPDDYEGVLQEMRGNEGIVSQQTNFRLAKKVFRTTSRYDRAISRYLDALGSE